MRKPKYKPMRYALCRDCGRGLVALIDGSHWCPQCGDAPLQLHNDPSAHKVRQVDNEPARQRELVGGMDCLPGQLDLFE